MALINMTTVEQTLTLTSCAACAIQFAVPDQFDRQRRQTGDTFWCPNGHTLTYKSEIDKLRKRLEAEQARRVHAEDQQQAAERRVAAARGQVTRLKNRIGNGVCPCCHRTFQQLSRHMATKHPGFKSEDASV